MPHVKIGRGTQRLILGPPGTGKTTRLLDTIEREFIEEQVDPREVAYVSFTKKAVTEAIERATALLGFTEKELPFFTTVHALCYRAIGIRRDEMLGREHYKDLSELLGYELSGYVDATQGEVRGSSKGDTMLFVANIARIRCTSLEDVYHELAMPGFTWHELKYTSDTYEAFKQRNVLKDFTDLLEMYIQQGRSQPVEVAVIDEAQDLSQLQWRVLQRAFSKAHRVYIAGDDDQAIYEWSGADVDTFLNLDGERDVLGHSYRLPRKILATSQKIIRQVRNRYAKDITPRDEEGSVTFHNLLQSVPFDGDSSWLFLARNVFLLNDMEEWLTKQGVPYLKRGGNSSINARHVKAIQAWEKLREGAAIHGDDVARFYEFLRVGHGVQRGFKGTDFDPDNLYTMADLTESYGLITDAIWHEALLAMKTDQLEYYLTALRGAGSAALLRPPKVRVDTIHGVKGGEADNVVLMTDMARNTSMSYRKNPDPENRVFYVGATRARNNLHIINAQTHQYYRGF